MSEWTVSHTSEADAAKELLERAGEDSPAFAAFRAEIAKLKRDSERPMERGSRGRPGFARLAAVVAQLPQPLAPVATVLPPSATRSTSIAPVIATPAGPGDRLEALERELYQLLASATPATWAAIRRPLTRLLRRARRDLRALERATSPLS